MPGRVLFVEFPGFHAGIYYFLTNFGMNVNFSRFG